MLGKKHVCADCRYLTRTSPDQVFLLCSYWSSKSLAKTPNVHFIAGYDYIVAHCHMQPWAPACPAFEHSEVRDGTDVHLWWPESGAQVRHLQATDRQACEGGGRLVASGKQA